MNGKSAQTQSPSASEIVRYTYSERVCHWTNGGFYSYCLLTGLALFTPHLYWLATVLGGGPTISYWHPWAGSAFMATVLWMHRMWHRDMRYTKEDHEFRAKLKYYISNRDELLPPQGRFNGGQKQFYWVMFYGAIVLLATGIVLWVPEYLPRGMHWILPWTMIAHEIAALATIGAFIIHVYMGVVAVSGGLKAILVGHVSRQWAHHHHRLWYEQITGGRERQ